MKNLYEIKNRFLKEPFNKRLGHLASDLLRISAFLETAENTKAVNDILEESKFFIEWTAPDAPLHIQEFLSGIQPILALWQLRLAHPENHMHIKALQKISKTWSVKLIEFSGLAV